MLKLKLPLPLDKGRNGRNRSSRPHLILHAAAALVLVISLFVSLAVFFPGEILRQRIENAIYRQSGKRVIIGGLAAAPPLGLLATDVSWQPPVAAWPPARIKSIRFSPVWTTLFGDNPGLVFKASPPTGSLNGQVMKDGSLQAHFAKISLSSILPSFTYQPQGMAAGSIATSGRLLGEDGRAEFNLSIDEAAVLGLEKVGLGRDRISLGRLTVKGELQGSALKIEEVRNQDGDLHLQGRLTILLNESLNLSRISGQVDLTPTSSLDPVLRDLLQLGGFRPDRQGNFRLRISGSLENPAIR